MAWTTPRTWVASETMTASLMNAHLRDNLNAAFPVGSLSFYMQAATAAAVTTINGFALEANASTPSRATFASLNTLLSALSYPWGSGDGSTTFTMPDCRNRTLVFAGGTGAHADANAMGDRDALSLANRTPLGSVSVSISGTTGSESSHTHTITTGTSTLNATGGASWLSSVTSPSGAGSAHSHSFSGSGSGSMPGVYNVLGICGVKY
jgi:hypothetical protein